MQAKDSFLKKINFIEQDYSLQILYEVFKIFIKLNGDFFTKIKDIM